jgi:hypothetical protein
VDRAFEASGAERSVRATPDDNSSKRRWGNEIKQILRVCATKGSVKNTKNLQEELKSQFWTGFAALVVDFAWIPRLRLCIFFWVFARCALVDLTISAVRNYHVARNDQLTLRAFESSPNRAAPLSLF